MNLPTVIVLLVVFALVVMALNALHSGKGSCSCGKHNEKKKGSLTNQKFLTLRTKR